MRKRKDGREPLVGEAAAIQPKAPGKAVRVVRAGDYWVALDRDGYPVAQGSKAVCDKALEKKP